MLNPCYVHGTTHVHGYVHACSCMFMHVKFWLPDTSDHLALTTWVLDTADPYEVDEPNRFKRQELEAPSSTYTS